MRKGSNQFSESLQIFCPTQGVFFFFFLNFWNYFTCCSLFFPFIYVALGEETDGLLTEWLLSSVSCFV